MQTTNQNKLAQIGIYCPTRKRVASLNRLIESIISTAKNPERVFFRLYVDSDDNQTIDYLKENGNKLNGNVIVEDYGTRLLSDTYNVLYENANDDLCMQFGDDTIMRTQNWDELIEATFQKYPDKLILAYGNDGIHNSKFSTHYCLSREWIETVGYMSAKYFPVDWSDAWAFEIAKSLDRHVHIPELSIEHAHWTQNKSEFDETYMLAEERRRRFNGEAFFHCNESVNLRKEAVEKLRKKINEQT